MKFIIGLGNPGEKYKNTRHNAGFLAIDRLAETLNTQLTFNKRLDAETATARYDGTPATLLKPMTFMNKSGRAVQKMCRQGNISPKDVLLVYDDIDLPFGEVRFRETGSAGGHRGVRSVLDVFDKSVRIARVRIGVGRPKNEKIPVKRWVLSRWSKTESKKLPTILDEAVARIETWLQ